ncbi:MAG: DeoR/GlpR family DNA-binding transcription regulator [Anaerobiospirillum succiniciproducens]|uniref:DeoR/GlpR family DNA-binding transcription regulator n=1 Tax=Anaerobiospirillum succiniciproducens TaxID=13335 RepID=UPI002356960A|nr:DeoR/GlpR family DNA-binding transcription regulator [Anaerobiospirillum succiniciproducens]MCI6863032.1 DeoR/GlpR family DNA-binding transcription regulator [Anaerobiospirillum succiniciproducens]MDY2798558.1 DeoR/GlpR family DNA-binding transcription regulator [Anaerobiospirillum succiniciproducens]
MAGQERSEQILSYLKSHNLVTVEELVKVTSYSAATIRRELVKLDAEGKVYRVHGGVTLSRFVQHQPTTTEKQKQHHQEKVDIATAGSKLINPNQAIILDAGTTTLELAKLITSFTVRVITPDVHIALLLSEHQNIEVTITGGTLDWSSQSCVGHQAVDMLNRLHPDIAFLSCNAFDLKSGITAPTYEKAYIKSTMLNQAKHKVLLADSSKFGKVQLFEVGKLTDIDTIITDKGLNQTVADEIRSIGIELILV